MEILYANIIDFYNLYIYIVLLYIDIIYINNNSLKIILTCFLLLIHLLSFQGKRVLTKDIYWLYILNSIK